MQKIFILFFLIFLVSGNCSEINSSKEISFVQPYISEERNQDIETLKNIANIFFFITMSIIGIYSYRQAKKTVFSPIKTEVFKYQLQAFEKIIEYFQNKSEVELFKDLDLEMIMEINTFNLYKDYVNLFIDNSIKMNPKYIDKYTQLSTRIKLVKGTHFDYFEDINYATDLDEKKTDDSETPSCKWNKKEYEMIYYTDNYHEVIEKIKSFQNSPLVPLELKSLINAYINIADDCLKSLGSVIEEVGKDMPNTFPTHKELKNFNTYGMLNIYSKKRPSLEPKAKEILTYINTYLNVEKVVEHGV